MNSRIARPCRWIWRALVRKLVELRGGTIASHGDGPGYDSTFTVMLPAA